jgi:NAD(P)-dependent dehydrogenase (short-subunit alcohol dehydrogenase family)
MKKKCLVVGGGSDIGRAVVTALHEEYDITWTYYNTHTDQPGTSVKCDLRKDAHIDEVLADLFDVNVDLVVTAAFPFIESGNFETIGYERVEPFLRAHVHILAWAAGKAVATQHPVKIFNMLGQCVERGLPGGAFYSAAFAFLHNYGNSLNGREGKTGVVSVCDFLLGPVNTREWEGLSEEVVARYESKVSQFIEPKQVAETLRFLANQPVLPSIFKLDAYYGF